MKRISIIIAALLSVWALSGCQEDSSGQLPKLCVQGTSLMNENGDTVVLHGVSFGWHQMWPRFYNEQAVTHLVKDWNAQIIRASMGIDLDSSCYVYNKDFGIECVTKVVDASIKNNVYAIIDWHSHNLLLDEAKEFFAAMATRYKGVPNVIYEIYNEPVDDTWEELKEYSVEVIKTIRAIEPDALILVGCPHWDQDIHLPAEDPITGFDNIMYTVHFYAATHGQWLRDRASYAISKGLPIFVSECGGMEATGNGPLSYEEWTAWKEWMAENSVSWVAWSLSDKDETCSMLLPTAASEGGWSEADIKEWGDLVRKSLAE